MAEEQFPNVYKVMDHYGEDVVNEMENILNQAKRRATGRLINSLDYDVDELGEGKFELTVEYESYGKYVESGRRAGAKQPPTKEIEKWLQVKRYTARKGKDIKSTAYVIAKAIKQKGIKPVNFNKPWTDLKSSSDFQNDIFEAYKKDVELQLQKTMNNK